MVVREKSNEEKIGIVTLNLGMGKSHSNEGMKSLAYFLAEKIANAQDINSPWIFCLQELQGIRYSLKFRDLVEEELHHLLGDRSKNLENNMHIRRTFTPGSSKESCVAILANRDPQKDQSWTVDDKDAAIACKFSLKNGHLWVINTHLSSRSSNKSTRIAGIVKIVERVGTFSARVPVAVAGDFNVTDIAKDSHGSRITVSVKEYDETVGELMTLGFERPAVPEGVELWRFSTKPPFAKKDTAKRDLIDYILCNLRMETLHHSKITLGTRSVEDVPFRDDAEKSPTDHRAVSCALTWTAQ